jgi:hypothetical protein
MNPIADSKEGTPVSAADPAVTGKVPVDRVSDAELADCITVAQQEAERLAANAHGRTRIKSNTVAALRELQQLRGGWRDTERMDWFDKHADGVSVSGCGADDRWTELIHHDGNRSEGATLRDAIDAAMATRGPRSHVRTEEWLRQQLAERDRELADLKAGNVALAQIGVQDRKQREYAEQQLAESERLSAARNKLNGELAMEGERLREALRSVRPVVEGARYNASTANWAHFDALLKQLDAALAPATASGGAG